MKCPHCGSRNIECIDTPKRHAHICNDCGRVDEYKPSKR